MGSNWGVTKNIRNNLRNKERLLRNLGEILQNNCSTDGGIPVSYGGIMAGFLLAMAELWRDFGEILERLAKRQHRFSPYNDKKQR